MDRICSALLDKIFSLSPAGRYVIFGEDELLDCLPEECEKNYEELNKALYSLSKGGYIDMKYSRGGTYCIAPLKRFFPEPEDAPLPVPEEPKRKKLDFVFLSAFAGGALGSLIISVIFALV